ncbi:MAG: hypothetical protein PHC75_07215 [Burkholderiales bacterium]|nr:hypothetical protein [Burkholderiales bacterium]
MGLLNFTNFDYVAMTFVFGALAAISYFFRRKNPDSKSFLSANNYVIGNGIVFLMLTSVGVLEFSIFSSLGALYGIGVSILIVVAYLLINILPFDKLSKLRLSLNDLLLQNKSTVEQRVFYAAYSIFMLLVSALAILTAVGFLKTWLGWEFGNSALSLLFVLAVCLLVGGFAAIIYSQAIFSIVILIILITAVFLSVHVIGMEGVIHNLQKVAIDNNNAKDFYFKFDGIGITQVLLMLISIMVIYIARPLNLLISLKNNKTSIFRTSSLIRTIIIALSLATGVLALATPKYSNLPEGTKIVSQPTRLEDGSMGITVKVVPSDTVAHGHGIVPQSMDFSGSFADRFTALTNDDTSYNYLESGFALIKHNILYASIGLLLLVILLYKTMVDSISFITLLIIGGFYAPYHNKTGEEYENLWASRVFMFTILAISLTIGLVFYKFFDFNYLSGIIVMFAIPVLSYILGLRLTIITYIINILFISCGLLLLDIKGVPSLIHEFNFTSWWDFVLCWSVSLFIINIIASMVLKLKKSSI